jgi:hypothetical protein
MLLFGVLCTLGLVGMCLGNPMLLMFIQPVGISNQSQSELHAIPMGRTEGALAAPPLYWTRFPLAIPRWQTEFVIPAGERLSFNYDYDDVNLCWLLVRDASSRWKVVPSSLEIPSCALKESVDAGCCRGLSDDFSFEIENLESLVDAPDWLVASAVPDGGL